MLICCYSCTICNRYGNVAGAKQTPRQQPLVSVNYGNYPPQASNDSDTSAYASYDPYVSISQHPQHLQQQQQQFGSAQPPQTYGQPAAEQSSGGYHASGQHPNFMDYTPQQSYVASSYQTLPYSSAPALAPQVGQTSVSCVASSGICSRCHLVHHTLVFGHLAAAVNTSSCVAAAGIGVSPLCLADAPRARRPAILGQRPDWRHAVGAT
jgi:hypothetical protein